MTKQELLTLLQQVQTGATSVEEAALRLATTHGNHGNGGKNTDIPLKQSNHAHCHGHRANQAADRGQNRIFINNKIIIIYNC